MNKYCKIALLSSACIAIMENTDMENTDMENTDTEYNDMPALRCSGCSGVASKGGDEWEKDNPSEQVGFCNCSQNNEESKTVSDSGFDSDSWHKIMEDLRILGEQTNDARLIQQANIGSAIVNDHDHTVSVLRNNF